MKDNFSRQSDQYAKYRPTYPPALFDYLYEQISNKQYAWDCGTGNGQVAHILAERFKQVAATDISQQQLDNALQRDNIRYSLQAAEKTNFPADSFNLVVVAQAIHWFDFDQFYAEVNRTAKNEALLCVIGYGRLQIDEALDAVISTFYQQVIGPYWDQERRYIDEDYQTIPFPFEEISAPSFVNEQVWTLEHLIGYLNTWSAVKHFINANHYNPIDQLQESIQRLWGSEASRLIRFPILLRIGRIQK